MTQDHPLFASSAAACLLLWAVSYLLIIRRGFRDRTYGMPFAALCINLAYELVFGFIRPIAAPINYVNMIWFGVDLVIASQYLRYGRATFPELLPRRLFVPSFLVCAALAAGAALALTHDLGLATGNSYLGWGAELVMDASFIALVIRRRGVEGQSLYIGLSRMLGSLAIIPAQEIEAPGLALVRLLYGISFLFNVTYLALYFRKCRLLGIDPWRRL
jgi:hypothetical protein